MTDIAFSKMNGLGNDFVMIDVRKQDVAIDASLAISISDRNRGVGCDSVIVVGQSAVADVSMTVFNADGSQSAACGNATRCVPLFLGSEYRDRTVAIETKAGILNTRQCSEGVVSVDMGEPHFEWHFIPLREPVADTRAVALQHSLSDGRVLKYPSVANIGNPHCIFWVTNVESYDLASFGPVLEHHNMFPERANISLAEVESERRIKLRVWERGVGITKACGTAACAAAAAAVRLGKTARKVDVALPGGTLNIEWRTEDNRIIMTGPAVFEFDGTLHLDANGSMLPYRGRQAA